MSEENTLVVDITQWVEKARHETHKYLERQATEILLTAIGMASPYGEKLFLKGGTLMGIVYNSPRQTADLDFTTTLQPEIGIDQVIRSTLDQSFPQAAARLGYPDLICRIQTIQPKPHPVKFPEYDFPALKIKIAYARRGSAQEGKLAQGICSQVINADISFNEPVDAIQVVRLGPDGEAIHAYSLIDLIAEKLRALLQQEHRNRYRRQDIYDLALLVNAFPLDDDEKIRLLAAFRETCRSRNIEPTSSSLADPEMIRRARREWHTLELELEEVPDFDTCLQEVEHFYRELPW
jgi:predicted nucleotidyltransferase component of viral defense system